MADFLLIALVIGCFLKAGRENRKIFESSPINLVVVLVVLGSIINLIRGYTFMELTADINLTRLMTWKNYMILPLIYFVTINTINKENMVKWIIICICFSMLAMDFNFHSTFKWLKSYHYSHDIRISGAFSFLGPNEMGIFFSQFTLLLFGISYFLENKRLRYFTFFVCACNMYPIIYSYSRATYMSVIAGLLTLGLLKDRRLLLLLFALIISYSAILPNSVVERIDMTFLDKQQTSEERLQSSGFDVGDTTIEVTGRKHLWEKAIDYFEQHPFVGIGFDTFRHKEGWITHSLYMKILAEQGLLGVIIFLLFAKTILQQSYKLFKHSKSKLGQGIGLGFLTCVIVHFVGSVSGDQTLYYNLMAIYWVFMGIVASFNIHFVDNDEPLTEESP